jgi:hypothetical protein
MVLITLPKLLYIYHAELSQESRGEIRFGLWNMHFSTGDNLVEVSHSFTYG